MLPRILNELKDRGDKTWRVRVVCNKYPALLPGESTERFKKDMYPVMRGYGEHEVIIESPEHDADIANMPVKQIKTVIEAYHARYIALKRSGKNLTISIFRNHGIKAGTSLEHPHSQIIAANIIPFYIRIKEREAERYFDDWGRCIYCDAMDFERRDGKRIIAENDSFLVFVPFAASLPFETWIMPKRHRSDFSSISGREKSDLAFMLHNILSRICKVLDNPDYNYVIHTFTRHKSRERHLHWHIEVKPRIITRAGFEIGSGININPYMPEDNAYVLKNSK